MNNFDEEIVSAAYPAGRFDTAMNILYGNDKIYNFLGNDVYTSLYKIVADEDKNKLAMAIDKCNCFPEQRFDESVHIRNQDEGYDTYLLNISKCQDAEEYYVDFINVSDIEHRIDDINDNLTKAVSYLTLIGATLLEYDSVTNRFKMFWVNNDEKVILYDMDFDQWIQKAYDDGMVTEEDKVVFESLCDSVKKLEAREYTFHSSLASFGDRIDTCHVKFFHKNYNGRDMVIGIWNFINEITGDEIENMVEGSYKDAMTGLLNKKAITDYAERAIQNAGKQSVAIAVMDIDNFKNVNDTYGHMFGDKVIKAAGDVIKNAIGNRGVAGRMGGDEFMIVFENYQDELNLRNMLRCIKTNMANVYQGKMGANKLTCSIGVSRYQRDAVTYKELFQIADKALYIAKQKGKNRYIIYEADKHGQFMVNSNDPVMVDIRDSFYAQGDIYEISRRLSDVIIYGEGSLSVLFEQAAATLMVDRISIFWGTNLELHHTNAVAADLKQIRPDILQNEQYFAMFAEDMLIFNNINTIEYSIPGVYGMCKEAGIHSTLQHLLRDSNGEVKGLLCADSCEKYVTFPNIALRVFKNISEVVNGVLIRDELRS